MGDFCIDEVYPKGDSYPLIAHFQNGYPADTFTDQHCELLENRISGKKCVATEINEIIYSGEETDEPLGKTLLLVRNRKTNKVRLIEVGNIELKPVLKTVTAAVELETSYVDLGRKFGSKRHKKRLEQNEKLKVSEEVVMEQLKNVSHNVTSQLLDISSYNKTDSEDFYIPPINRDATDLKDVYMISAMLTAEQYETIFTEIDNIDYKSTLFPYILEIFSNNWSKEQTVLAVFASTLLSLHSKKVVELKPKKFVACPSSATLDGIVLKEFFTYNSREGRSRPLQYRDKAMCHAIVFILLINNYKMELATFCKHFKMMETTASIKAAMTGAWTVREGTKKVAVLKLPLNKPTLSYKRKSAKF